MSLGKKCCLVLLASICLMWGTAISSPVPEDDNYEDSLADFRTKADLQCYECTKRPDNDTCSGTLTNMQTITALGQAFRCRVFEADGTVLSRGIVPLELCSEEAFLMVHQQSMSVLKGFAFEGRGPIYASCCNSDRCNMDFCTSERQPASNCSTLIISKRLGARSIMDPFASDRDDLSPSDQRHSMVMAVRYRDLRLSQDNAATHFTVHRFIPVALSGLFLATHHSLH